MEGQVDVHTSVCSAAVIKAGLVAAGWALSWEVMADHAKVCSLISNTLPERICVWSGIIYIK